MLSLVWPIQYPSGITHLKLGLPRRFWFLTTHERDEMLSFYNLIKLCPIAHYTYSRPHRL